LKKESLYLETSVISAYFDERELFKLESTRAYWRRLTQYDVCISKVVLTELEAIKDAAMRGKALDLVKDYPLLEETEGDGILSLEYISEGVIPRRYENDARQIAIASVNGVDYLVSWNFEHIVKVKTRRMVSLINLKHGYKPIEIVTPSEL